MNEAKLDKAGCAVWTFSFLLGIAVWAGIIIVATHFIGKYW